MDVIQILALVCAMSLDTFAASLAYAAKGIKIPVGSCIVLNAICAAVVGLGVEIGRSVCGILPMKTVSLISALILGTIAVLNISECWLKSRIKTNKKREFYFFDFHFILEIICDTTQADTDRSKTLSAKEACSLAIALSLDGFAVGIGAGLLGFPFGSVASAAFLVGIAAIVSGGIFGKKLSEYIKKDLSWISGVILLILAILKLKR